MKIEEIITDEQIEVAFGYSNFGERSKREVVRNSLLKCASGYNTGHTAEVIVKELGLVTTKWTLTKKGKQYLWAAYSNGISV